MVLEKKKNNKQCFYIDVRCPFAGSYPMSVHVWGGSGLVSIPISGLLVSVGVFTVSRINLMVSGLGSSLVFVF